MIRVSCPACGEPSSRVDVETVKALLTESALGRLPPSGFHFCPGAVCDVVYFSGDGEIFRTGDVRVAVWQKEPPGRRMLCYCFGENEAAMQHEIQTTGRTLAVNRVRHHISERRCACDVRNPRGSCCLGDLMRATRQFESQEPEPA